MKAWISTAGFASVLMLVSVDAAARSDSHLQHPSAFFHYIRANQSDPPTALRQIIQTRYASFLPQDAPGLPIFCAGGLAARLLAALTSSSPDTGSVEVNTLVAYVAEGDNRLDAKAFACEVVSIFNHIRSGKKNFLEVFRSILNNLLPTTFVCFFFVSKANQICWPFLSTASVSLSVGRPLIPIKTKHDKIYTVDPNKLMSGQ
jgi:hypothetical protein